MAQVVENKAGFKVIGVSRRELVEKLGHIGAIGICDFCASSPEQGYYVAVLDQWYCPKCYNRFIRENQPNTDDKRFEGNRFNWFRKVFGL